MIASVSCHFDYSPLWNFEYRSVLSGRALRWAQTPSSSPAYCLSPDLRFALCERLSRRNVWAWTLTQVILRARDLSGNRQAAPGRPPTEAASYH